MSAHNQQGRAAIPPEVTSFIGRERELAAVQALLLQPHVRLLTLTGPGGVGKTRLALKLVTRLQDTFSDGVFFVPLAPLADPALVASTIVHNLGIIEPGNRSLLDSLKTHLCDKHMLLVLDNFEQVLAAAWVVAEVLMAPHVKVLVTSRATLHLIAEHEYPVPPLSVPDRKGLTTLESLSQYESVALFIQRAQASKPDFQMTHANAPAVAEICARLDGLPLAIELAAARIKILSPQVMLARLESRLKLLTGGARDLPARQQAIRATIDWSYSLLEAGEQLLFARLGIFVGGCSLDAAEAVCNKDRKLPFEVLDGIQSLLDKSLLQREAGSNNEPRFGMLETIREYACEQLVARGETTMLRQWHAAYYLALAETAELEFLGPQQLKWIHQLESEHDNVRAVLEWYLEHGEVEMAARLCAALWKLWYVFGSPEGRQWLEHVLHRKQLLSLPVRAKLLIGAGALTALQGDRAQAIMLCEESLALSRILNNAHGSAFALNILGWIALELGQYTRAGSLLEESLVLWGAIGDPWGTTLALLNLGMRALYQNDTEQAGLLLEESLVLWRAIGDAWGTTLALTYLGILAVYRSDANQATSLFEEGLLMARDVRDTTSIILCLEGLSAAAGLQGQRERATKLWGAAEEARAAMSSVMPPLDQERFELLIAAVRTQLDEATWAAAWEEGRAMSLDQAITYALERADVVPEAVPPSTTIPESLVSALPVVSTAYPAGLTEREVEVLRLLAEGLTYHQIANHLVISPRTVNRHLSTIYGKLNVTSRHAATHWAREHSLV